MTNNFLGLTEQFSELSAAGTVILPIAFDQTASWQRGSERGPKAIIEASKQVELYDIETGLEAFKSGIFTGKELAFLNSEALVEAVKERVDEYLTLKKFVVCLGGEHTVALGAMRAHAERFPNMSVLHLDAHADLRDQYEGNPLSHACVMARVKEFVPNVVSFGVRSVDSSELSKMDPKKIFYAEHHAAQTGAAGRNWISRILEELSPDVYVTLDVDVFDPGIMPSTGTPEPGGVGWYEVLALLRAVIAERNLVGMDVVELMPLESNRAPDFLVAKLIYKVLSYREAKRGGTR